MTLLIKRSFGEYPNQWRAERPLNGRGCSNKNLPTNDDPLPTNDDPLPTNDGHKARIYQQAIE